ncbi:hypothetical protein VTN77DRAFT_3236 [Rasamsonia byssochlamydoides]|uniref:uncharacterized protein n=1 Tax=Rasamsonia byssochlamydoides TaxID=89139 RepID=UPI0037447F13
MGSRSSFSSLSHPSYASDEQEAVYLARARALDWIRFSIAVIILGAAAAVVGCEGYPLNYYKHTVSFEKLWLPLWPLNLDVRQTNALLACGVVIMFQALIYIVAAIVPSPHPRTRLLNFIASAIAVAGFVTAIVGVVFSIYLPSATYPNGFTSNETIHSWTCKWQSLQGVNATTADGQPLTAPADFSRNCVESRAGFILLGLLIGLEVIMGAAAAAGWWLEQSVTKQRKAGAIELGQVDVKKP